MSEKLQFHLLNMIAVVLLAMIVSRTSCPSLTYTVGFVLSLVAMFSFGYGHLLPHVLRSIAQIIHDLLRWWL